jgi:hypothetical protein
MEAPTHVTKVPFYYNGSAMLGLLLEAFLIFSLSGILTTVGLMLLIPQADDMARPFIESDDNSTSSFGRDPFADSQNNERQLQDVEEFFEENGLLIAVITGFTMAALGVITAFIVNALAWFIGREAKGQGDFYSVVRWSNRLDILFIPLFFFGFFLLYYSQTINSLSSPFDDVDKPNLAPLLCLSMIIPIGYLAAHALLLGEYHKLSTGRGFGIALAAALGGQYVAGMVGACVLLPVFFIVILLLASA